MVFTKISSYIIIQFHASSNRTVVINRTLRNFPCLEQFMVFITTPKLLSVFQLRLFSLKINMFIII